MSFKLGLGPKDRLAVSSTALRAYCGMGHMLYEYVRFTSTFSYSYDVYIMNY